MLSRIFKKHIRSFLLPFALCAFAVTFVTSCGNDPKAPDVSGIKIDIKSRRLDKDLYTIDTSHIAAGLQQLEQKYPDFLNFYLDTLLGFNIYGRFADTTSGIRYGLRSFLTHKDYRGLYDTVIMHYPDVRDIEQDLAKGFRYMKHYYPDYKVPNIIYLVTGLNNWGAFTYGDQILGIGLDMFLGEGYPYYRSVGIPDYMALKLRKDYIPVAVFRAIYQDRQPFVPEDNTLLDMMIQRGKEMYFVDHMLPFLPLHVKLGYTEDQLKWCEENEAMVYNFFAKENLLYEKDWQKILRYVNDGPTSAGMPAESPGNIGAWVGLRIVDAYAAKHPQLSVKELVNTNKDAQTFLQQSGYKPH